MRWWPWLLFPTLASVACEREFYRPTWQPGEGAGASGEGGGGNAGTESAGSGAQSSGTGGVPRGGTGGAGAGGDASSDDGGNAGVFGPEAGNGGTGESNRPPTAVFDFYYLDREDADDGEEGAGGESGAPSREPGSYTIRGGVGSLSSNDLDPDGDTLRVEAGTVDTERGGTVKLTAGGGFTYTPPSKRFWGNDYFEYSVSDGRTSSKGRARITLTVSVVQLDELDAGESNGWLIVGSDQRQSLGYFAGRAGDVNGDGLDDLIVAASWGLGSGSYPESAAYVVFGRTETTPVLLDEFETGTSAGFMIKGFRPGLLEPGVLLEGWPVNGVGDVNGDGFDDIAIRSLPYSSAPQPVVYVVFGGRGTDPVVLNTINDEGTSSSGIRINPLDPPAAERFGTA
ncbi:MAG TPA: Ig-like domain-containing protein, partial [Polyangiaceae bacterium]